MMITITTESGAKVAAPTEKWVAALVVALADLQPEQFVKVLSLIDKSADAFASVPGSVQASLNSRF